MKKIMIVDDESDISYTVKNGLESIDAQYRVMCVETGEECIKVFKNNELPDVILLDIMLLGMNGWALYKKIKNNLTWKDIPIIFLTNRTDSLAWWTRHDGHAGAQQIVAVELEVSLTSTEKSWEQLPEPGVAAT